MLSRSAAHLLTLGLALFAIATGCAAPPPATEPPDEVPIADCHVHILDFLQNGDYLENGAFVYSSPKMTLPAGERGKRIEAFLAAMDDAGVSHAMISGMPFLKKWSEDETFRSGYYLDSGSRVVRARDTDYVVALAIEDFLRAGGPEAEKAMRRLYPFVCGFDGTDVGAVDMIIKRVKEFPGTFKGIGEVMSRHDDLTHLTAGQRPRANHPALMRIFDFAGEHGVPVSIHHNVAPVSPDERTKVPRYLPELLDVFDEFRQTNFIWCHAGISRRINVQDLPVHLGDLLAEHGDHVYIDLSWVVYEDYVLPDLDRWVALIEAYPDNFMVGSDVVARYDGYRAKIRKYDVLFAALGSRETVEKVARGNFLRIMPDEGLTLPPDYEYPELRYTWRRIPQPER